MRIIKLGLISLIAFALLITMFSLFFPSHIRLSKAIDINASRTVINNEIADIQNWKNWYPGADTMELIMDGNNIKGIRANQNGGQTIVTTVTDTTIITETTGNGFKKSISGWNIYSTNIPNTYTVQWYMDFYLRWYPWEKFSGLLLEKRYGPSMERGLEKLRESVVRSP